MTIPQAGTDAPALGHDVEPDPENMYTMEGMNVGRRANLMNVLHYPVETTCRARGCGQVVRAEHAYSSRGFEHTGRMPGQDPVTP